MWAEWGAAKFVRDVGVPGVIALLLVWVVSTQVMQAIEQHDADSAAVDHHRAGQPAHADPDLPEYGPLSGSTRGMFLVVRRM